MKIKLDRFGNGWKRDGWTSLWGRFGDGWSWKIGMMGGGKTIVIDVLVGSIRIEF